MNSAATRQETHITPGRRCFNCRRGSAAHRGPSPRRMGRQPTPRCRDRRTDRRLDRTVVDAATSRSGSHARARWSLLLDRLEAAGHPPRQPAHALTAQRVDAPWHGVFARFTDNARAPARHVLALQGCASWCDTVSAGSSSRRSMARSTDLFAGTSGSTCGRTDSWRQVNAGPDSRGRYGVVSHSMTRSAASATVLSLETTRSADAIRDATSPSLGCESA